MKDFYDLWFLSRRFDFDGATLHQAIAATFGRRSTALNGELLPFTADFIGDADRQTQWRAFLTRNGIEGPPEDFPQLMRGLHDFLGPVLHPTDRRWSASAGWK